MGGGGGGGRGDCRSENGLAIVGVCAVLFLECTGYVRVNALFGIVGTCVDVMDGGAIRVKLVFA